MKTDTQEWEDKCLQCGLCCHEKIIFNDLLVIDLDSYCEHYNPFTKQCLIYDTRFDESNRCNKVTLKLAMFSSALPSTCGYVKWAETKHLRRVKNKKTVLIHSKNPAIEDLPYIEYFREI